MIGVAPEAELLSVSVGFGSSATRPFSDQIADAIRWSVDNGADVINMSLTTNAPDWDESWDDAFLYAFEHDVVIVVAAGNRGSGTTRVGAPATIPGVLTVGGVDRAGKASVEASTQGITIGVSAPSEELVGVSADGTLVLVERHERRRADRRRHRGARAGGASRLDADNVINRIIQTARPVGDGPPGPTRCTASDWWMPQPPSRRDVPSVTANPMGSLEEWIRLYRRAPMRSDCPRRRRRAVEVPALPDADAPHARHLAAAARSGHPALRHPAAPAGHSDGYTGGARRHRCCPTHPIGVPRAEPLTQEEYSTP